MQNKHIYRIYGLLSVYSMSLFQYLYDRLAVQFRLWVNRLNPYHVHVWFNPTMYLGQLKPFQVRCCCATDSLTPIYLILYFICIRLCTFSFWYIFFSRTDIGKCLRKICFVCLFNVNWNMLHSWKWAYLIHRHFYFI